MFQSDMVPDPSISQLEAFLLDALLIMLITLIGWLFLGYIFKRDSRVSRISLSFIVGAGIMSWTLFLVGWLKIPIGLPSVVGLAALLLLFGGWIHIRFGLSNPASRKPHRRTVGKRTMLGMVCIVVILGFIFLYLAYLSVGRSYSSFDALTMWATKGYGIAYEGSIWQGSRWGGMGLAYPLHIMLLIAIFKLISGDILPGSKLIFPLFFVSYLLFTFDFLRRRGLKEIAAIAVTLLISTIPIFVNHATIGYANLPMAVYLIPGLLLMVEGILEENNRAQIVGSLLLGFTVWTIIEGVLFVAVGFIAVVVSVLIMKKGKIDWISAMTPLLLVGGSWLLFYLLYAASGSQASSAVDKMLLSWRNGQINFPDIRLILGYARRNVFEVSTWGYLFPAGLAVSILGFRQLHPKRNAYAFAVLLVLVAIGALSLGLFYLRSFAIEGLYDLLVRGFPRGFISPAILFPLFMGILMAGIQPRSDSKNSPPPFTG